MGIIFIGDRFSGKTHLAMELSNPRSKYVSIKNQRYDQLRAMLYDENAEETKPTDAKSSMYNRSLDIKVTLPVGDRDLFVDWVDTPGEIWRSTWQTDNSAEWKNFITRVRDSEGVLLILSPFRELIKSEADKDQYIREQQWVKRFDKWVDFFKSECPSARRIGICLNKIDLLMDCDVDREAAQLAYEPYYSKMTWQQRHSYVTNRYMRPILPQLEQINSSLSSGSICCFITTVHNRTLLELPWIYLASYLSA